MTAANLGERSAEAVSTGRSPEVQNRGIPSKAGCEDASELHLGGRRQTSCPGWLIAITVAADTPGVFPDQSWGPSYGSLGGVLPPCRRRFWPLGPGLPPGSILAPESPLYARLKSRQAPSRSFGSSWPSASFFGLRGAVVRPARAIAVPILVLGAGGASRIACRLWNMRGALVGSPRRLLLVFWVVLAVPSVGGLLIALFWASWAFLVLVPLWRDQVAEVCVVL